MAIDSEEKDAMSDTGIHISLLDRLTTAIFLFGTERLPKPSDNVVHFQKPLEDDRFPIRTILEYLRNPLSGKIWNVNFKKPVVSKSPS